MDKDDENVKHFNPNGLLRTGICFGFRQIVIGTLLRVQFPSNASNEALHLAVTYADRFIWTQETNPLGYGSMAHGALWLAVKVLTPETPVTCPLMEAMTSGYLTVEEIEEWAEYLRLNLGPDLHYPTPHSYLDKFLKESCDLPAYHIKLIIRVCHYLLDLGLMEHDLGRRPAYLRCAGMIYFLRRLLRFTGHVLGGSPSQHEYTALSYWPLELERCSGCKEDENLKEVASTYGRLLEETKKYQQQCAQSPLVFMPIVEKYLDRVYGGVAAHPLVTDFELEKVMCPNEEE
ncbi:unnamed protein product [Hydatigera taeniaeformis]|uniref:Cyclin_C domain-containing protein n=1 Tax=Hydatigena taeniaeformis TaxID=6205 RepID=A0A0R3WPP5_HYDTA|nr:unnamed protein product [Hydatigera taeniaeformis]